MTTVQFLYEVFDTKAFGGQQYDEVIEHIRTLVGQLLLRACAGLDNSLKGFFTHLLCDTLHTILKQFCRITPLWHLLMPLVDKVLQLLQEQQGIFFPS